MTNWLIKSLTVVLLLAAMLLPATAQADEAVRAGCHAGTALVRGVDHPRLPPASAWVCNSVAPGDATAVAWSFFTPADFAASGSASDKSGPSHFVTDIGRFERISLIAMGPEGPLRSRSYGMEDVRHFVNGPKFALPLPDMLDATGLVVAIERPWTHAMVAKARLQAQHGEGDALGWSDDMMLAIAFLIGLLTVPLAYHLAFRRILREGIVLWQIGTQLSLLALVLVSSGLIHHLVSIDLATTCLIASLAMALPALFATGFLVSYLEEDALGETTRKLVMSTAVATVLVAAAFCLPIAAMRAFADTLFLGAPLPLLAAVAYACIEALRAGSRAIRFQIAAWAPFAAGSLLLVASKAGLARFEGAAEQLIYLMIAFHVAVSAYAILYRVDRLRQERERANAKVDALSSLIDLDPLTGIFNRRALEQRFAQLRASGFHALAVVDLDHFKRINDRFGHTTGDRVLQEVAAVLAGDGDAMAFRMGGEEFVVLLRGAQVQQRAEQMRRAITIRIANEIDGIDAPVTASMGLIESPPGGSSTLRHLYSHADRLLYEAKYSGRNRLISERMQVFEPPARERRLNDRRKQARRGAEA